ncbi:MAG: carboxylating nicotinate-nucleotide diphosphorylase [Pseudomonadota bacterium]
MLNILAVKDIVRVALAEDVGFGDLTASVFVDPAETAAFALVARAELVVCGLDLAAEAFAALTSACRFERLVADGDACGAGDRLATVTGPVAALLTAERTALNFLQHLSGIATLTAQYVAEIEGTGCRLLDTRKTTPGVRAVEKYAVRCGGGHNHRLALDGGIMIKDNHIAVAGSIDAAVARARAAAPLLTRIEVECDTHAQVDAAVAAGADVIMLDNMALEDMRTAVARVAGRAVLEASGGVTLKTIRAIAETGVDAISVGRITQSAPAVDIGMDAVSAGT